MNKHTFTLSIDTPEGPILDNVEVTSVLFSAEDGQLQVLANHQSLMTSVKYTKFVVQIDDTNSETYLCRNGVFTFNQVDNTAKLLIEYCQPQEQVSGETMHSYLSFIEEKLANKESLKDIELVYLENEQFAVKEMIK